MSGAPGGVEVGSSLGLRQCGVCGKRFLGGCEKTKVQHVLLKHTHREDCVRLRRSCQQEVLRFAKRSMCPAIDLHFIDPTCSNALHERRLKGAKAI